MTSEKDPIPNRQEVTVLLQQWSGGSNVAAEKLMPLIYAELRRLARRSMRRENPQHTLETGALINEVYMRFADWKNARWENRAHFYGVACQVMRRVLVDYARARTNQKRGGKNRPVSLEDAIVASPVKGANLIALDEALERLAQEDSRKARVVELRFFGGLTVEETAALLEVSPFTVIRDWNMARVWLHREIRGIEERDT